MNLFRALSLTRIALDEAKSVAVGARIIAIARVFFIPVTHRAGLKTSAITNAASTHKTISPLHIAELFLQSIIFIRCIFTILPLTSKDWSADILQ